MSWPDPALLLSAGVYKVLLVAYPREFREEYGAHMVQVFADACREERRRGAAPGLVRLWVRTVLDLAATAFVERSRAMQRTILIPLALILGLLIALVDSSPGYDATGLTAFTLFLCCGLLGAAHPGRPWQWALAVGLWIPVLTVVLKHNDPAAMTLPLVFTFAGAYAGHLVGTSISSV